MPSADRLIEIFNEANGCPPGEPRDRFLAETCKEDAELRDQILSLIASHQAAEGFLEIPMLPGVSGGTEKPGDFIGRYKLLEKVGEGGCGVVYVAEQTDPVRRRVAVKVIKLGMDTSHVIARFEAERQALAMMDHPNIAKVLDAGSTEAGRPFFVMELVRDIRITEYCDQHKLQTKERLDLFIKVCQAIQHAHQKGIIHRDIKPSNILVTMHDGVPVPKVIDFGIAKATEGRLTDHTVYTQLHQFIGTPAYMSPEQAEMSGLDVDTRSDIYSLGVLLYELLVGTTPFDGKELVASGLDAMRKTIREKEPTRPSTKLSQVLGASEAGSLKSSTGKPATEEENLVATRRLFQTKETIGFLRGDLDWIVMKCLEKDRTRRYDTANGLFQDIQRHLTNEPVVARPPSQLYRFQKAFRRNKVSFTAAAAVVVALVLGIGVSSWQAFEAGRQRLRAQNERDKSLAAKLEAEESQRAEKEARLQAEAKKINAEHDRYVANINLAGQAWEHDNFGRMRKVLEDTRGFADRGFEWYYW
ncbi:MAG TPA: serine/threonine-protein kinase [Verrucomicrobiae bacterium]|nr:serine/threonine-protein kinase [Verrucomicrobiae bacterium]